MIRVSFIPFSSCVNIFLYGLPCLLRKTTVMERTFVLMIPAISVPPLPPSLPTFVLRNPVCRTQVEDIDNIRFRTYLWGLIVSLFNTNLEFVLHNWEGKTNLHLLCVFSFSCSLHRKIKPRGNGRFFSTSLETFWIFSLCYLRCFQSCFFQTGENSLRMCRPNLKYLLRGAFFASRLFLVPPAGCYLFHRRLCFLSMALAERGKIIWADFLKRGFTNGQGNEGYKGDQSSFFFVNARKTKEIKPRL